jgi:hypothetical protein
MKILGSKTTTYQFVQQFTTKHADRDESSNQSTYLSSLSLEFKSEGIIKSFSYICTRTSIISNPLLLLLSLSAQGA